MNKEFLDYVHGLSEEEKKNLVEQVLGMMAENDTASEDEREECVSDLVRRVNGNVPACPYCGSAPVDNVIIRKGYKKNGAQRYYCKNCNSFFVPSSGTAFAHTHKPLSVWRKFIELTITGATLAVCAKECSIAYQTAFTWRHKILNVFRVAQESIVMGGYVEADEMLVNLSYKGNHIRGRVCEKGQRTKTPGVDTRMPREACRRGSDNKPGKHSERACVFCMVENANQTFYGAVPGVGFMNVDMLNATVAKSVNRESATVLVDQYKTTANYLKDNNYRSVVLAANTSKNPKAHKPEIRGEERELHLQHINAMHSHLGLFMKDYCGVSSKYLANYVSLFVWLKNNDAYRHRHSGFGVSEERAAYTDCYVSQKEIEARPMVPTWNMTDAA